MLPPQVARLAKRINKYAINYISYAKSVKCKNKCTKATCCNLFNATPQLKNNKESRPPQFFMNTGSHNILAQWTKRGTRRPEVYICLTTQQGRTKCKPNA